MASFIFLIVLSLIVLIYNGYVLKNYGVPESLSETAYLFRFHGKSEWLFTYFCLIVAFILFPIWVSQTNENYQFLTFLSCGGMIFAGITPLFKEEFQKAVHYTSGIIAMIAYLAWMIWAKEYYVLFAEIALFANALVFDKKNYTYYAEVICLVGLIVILFNKILPLA